MRYNDHSDFFYRHIYGDKDTFHLAWRKCGLGYAMPKRGAQYLWGTITQYDFANRLIFQHRHGLKWQIYGYNQRVGGFRYEKECLDYLGRCALT